MSGEGFLTDKEVETIVLSVLQSGPATEKQALIAVQWASGVRVDQALLDKVLDGTLLVSVKYGKPRFSLRVKP